MNNTLDQSLEQQGFPHLLSHRMLIVGISIVTILFLLLLADIFYIQFPIVTHTGDASLQQWVGPDASKLVGMALGLLFGGCYLIVAIYGTRGPEMARAWKLGVIGGAGAGVIVFLLYSLTGLITISLEELLIPVFALYGFALLGMPVVGFLGGKREGRISAGTIAGFWFGAILVLVATVSMLARDALFAQHLSATVWRGDHFGDLTCQGATGSKLIGCEVGDDLGLAANILLVFPLFGLLLGTGSGLLGRLFSRQKTLQVAHWNMALVSPLVCMGFLLIVFAAEVIWKIW